MTMKSYIVIGLGRFGSSLARQLCQLGAEVLAMDVSSTLVQQIASDVTHAVVGDAQDKEVLRALGVRDFDCAVIAIGDDLAASVLTTMNLKELEVPYIVCKAHDETHRRVLEKLGVDRVVIPEQEHAQRLARSLHSHNVLDYIELSEEYGILEVPAPKSWVGKTLKELNVRAKLGVNIIAVESGKVTNVSPAADYRIQAGDIMVVLGENYALEAVQKL
ncbi:MAG: TrkA family potassium uptake protein [Oscillospiraceae bacterium]|nr:TrkA family potassium uptake protein [Oscillospiraceae bacterium]